MLGNDLGHYSKKMAYLKGGKQKNSNICTIFAPFFNLLLYPTIFIS